MRNYIQVLNWALPVCSFFPVFIHFSFLFFSLHRTNNLTASLQNQIQSLRDSMSKITEDKNGLQKEIETKNHELQEKIRTIAQIKKIGRRYRTQYDELKVAHDKVLVTITA